MKKNTLQHFSIYVLIITIVTLNPLIYAKKETSNTIEKSLIQEALTKKLYHANQWLALGHYKKNKITQQYKSNIISNDFFLAKNGQKNPKEELIATIKGYFTPSEPNNINHPQCRFPARYLWLKKQLSWPHTSPITCNNYTNWVGNISKQSIELIFVTGYLGNPASYFGHILLNIEEKNILYNTTLLDKSINFGAIVPVTENPITYMIKGIFGGYKATFSDQYFFNFNHRYTENEQRNLYAYKLALNNNNRNFLIAHLWELLGKEFKYYFFTKNCASYMTETLNIITPNPIPIKKRPWAIPQQLFHTLSENPSSYTEISYTPSRQQLFYNKYETLTHLEKTILASIINHNFNLQLTSFNTLSKNQKRAILDCLIDYINYINKKEKVTINPQELSNILLARLNLKTHSPKIMTTSSTPPHLSQKPATLKITNTLSNNDYIPGIKLSASYYDLLSFRTPPNKALILGSLTVENRANQLNIKNITLLEIKQLGVSPTKLPYDTELTYTIYLGINSLSNANESANTLVIQSGLGQSFLIKNKTLYYMLKSSLLHNKHTVIEVNPHIGIIYKPTAKLHSMLTSSYQFKNYFRETNNLTTTLTIRHQIQSHNSIEVTIENENDIMYTVSYLQHF
ncbi:hypothetical protein DID76_01695 [Candidatus Marinamargulisbacteria bacterium SCGC AG-414-C22]|nr:hypothetical protein DID76_01695 [Candidatus Marinamargulisbacteria bacterium SCGC AG-414-C22]